MKLIYIEKIYIEKIYITQKIYICREKYIFMKIYIRGYVQYQEIKYSKKHICRKDIYKKNK